MPTTTFDRSNRATRLRAVASIRQRRGRHQAIARALCGAVAAVLFANVVVFASSQQAGAAVTLTVRGHLACPSGQPVVGAWLQSSAGGSGFAEWVAYPGATTGARVSKTITTNLPTTIYFNVGCGGSSSRWDHSYRTPSKTASSGVVLYYNAECASSGACTLYPLENNTPAAPSSNPGVDPSQCTWRASDFWKLMTGRFPNWGGNAGWWDDYAAATGWTVRSWPRPDSIAVWQPSMTRQGLGHLGYVADVRVSNGVIQMKIHDRNWAGPGVDRRGEWVNFIPGMKFILAPPRTGTTLY